VSGTGGVPMVQEDKDWILGEFRSHIAEVKLAMVKDIAKAIKDLPCEERMRENHDRDLKMQGILQRMDNGEKFEDKIARASMVANAKKGIVIRRWQLVVAVFVAAVMFIPNILDIIQFVMKLKS